VAGARSAERFQTVLREDLRDLPSYDAEVEDFLRYVDRRLIPYMKRAADHVADIAGLKDGVVAQIKTGGKRLRAGLCIVACEMFGGEALRALPFAAAIEHLQNFTLVHDDIADGDDERRSQPSIWKRYGVPHAITIGDAFIALGCLSILDSPYPAEVKVALMKLVAERGLQIAAGQTMDVNFRDRETVDIQDYIDSTALKTGAFLALALEGGALLGGASEWHTERLGKFAAIAGVAFQIKDDLLDFTGAKGRTVGADIAEGKMTAVAIHALRSAEPDDARRLRGILRARRHATSRADIEWVLELYRRTASLEFAERLSERMMALAARQVATLPDNGARERFVRIARYLARRAH
jgi:geranylgeranyl pyrophosphate synthase